MVWSAAWPSVAVAVWSRTAAVSGGANRTDVPPDDRGRRVVAPALVEAVRESVAAGGRTCLDLVPVGVSSSVDESAPVIPEVCWPPELRTITPDSWVVMVSDDFAGSDSSAELSDSSVEAAEEAFDA